jgi:hypothetical protein
MTKVWPILVYGLCLGTSVLCAALLLRAWWRSRMALLLWTAISFVFLALNNIALVADMIFFPAISLWLFRFIPALFAVCVLLYGFIWESER